MSVRLTGVFLACHFFCWDNGAISSSKIIFGIAVFILHHKLRRDGCVLIVSFDGLQGLRTLVFWRRALTVNYQKIFPRCPKWCPTISSCFGYIFGLFLNLTNLFFQRVVWNHLGFLQPIYQGLPPWHSTRVLEATSEFTSSNWGNFKRNWNTLKNLKWMVKSLKMTIFSRSKQEFVGSNSSK